MSLLLGMGSKNLFITGKNGSVLTTEQLKQGLKSSDFANDKSLLKLFNFYNTNNKGKSSDILDKDELNKMYKDLLAAAGNDNVLDPAEICQYVTKKFGSSVKLADVLNFIKQIQVNSSVSEIYDDIDGIGTSSTLKSNLSKVPPENITAVLTKYKNENGVSLTQDIADEIGSLGSTRNDYMKIIRDKLVYRAKQVGVNPSDFIVSFDAELKNIDMTIFKGSNTGKLDKIINNFLAKLAPKEKIYEGNKNGILMMMSDSDLCRTDKDKNELLEKIMKLSSKYNPKGYLENIVKNSQTPATKKAATMLLNSNFLDYYPIYIASIIAQESQFRESDSAVFTSNGQGIMQLTSSMISDMYKRPGSYDDGFMKNIMKNYKDSTDLYKAVQNKNDSSLNIEVALVGLKGKLNSILVRQKTGYYEKNFGIKPDSAEDILELMAMEYNGNDDAKKDKKYSNKLSQVRYVYARDVIQRFKKYTPADVKINHYFEYNPNTKKIINN